MAIQESIYTPRTLGQVVRRMPPVKTFFRSACSKRTRN